MKPVLMVAAVVMMILMMSIKVMRISHHCQEVIIWCVAVSEWSYGDEDYFVLVSMIKTGILFWCLIESVIWVMVLMIKLVIWFMVLVIKSVIWIMVFLIKSVIWFMMLVIKAVIWFMLLMIKLVNLLTILSSKWFFDSWPDGNLCAASDFTLMNRLIYCFYTRWTWSRSTVAWPCSSSRPSHHVFCRGTSFKLSAVSWRRFTALAYIRHSCLPLHSVKYQIIL